MTLNVQIVGLNELIADVKKAGIDAKPLVRGALQNSATIIQRNVRQRAAHKTGALQRSIQQSISYPSATVEVLEKYGAFVEDGTKPHIIRPKNKKALFWKGALNPYKVIRHPGTRAKPFFKPGVEASQDGVIEQFVKVTERLINIMAGR